MAEKKKSSRAMKVVAGFLSVLAFACGAVYVYGWAQDEAHTASGSAVINAKVADVFARQADVQGQTKWRPELKEVRDYKAGEDGLAEWTEDWGRGRVVTLRHEEIVPDKRIKVKLEGPGGAFYGTWTFEFEPAEGGTRVTITEEGGIPNAFIRGMYSLMAAPDATLKKHLDELKAACETH